MCLIVNSPKMIAKTDLVVYKCLDHRPVICTPFQGFPINFINGEKYLVMRHKELHGLEVFHGFIHEGVHAYYNKKKADLICTGFQRTKTKTHYAIIPNGCEYYLGNSGDIVSTDMIVFRTREDYRKYKREHEVKSVK